MSTQVKDFEEDFASLAENARREISALRATFPDPGKPEAPTVSNRSDRCNNITDIVRRLRECLSQLEIEGAQVAPPAQMDLRERIKAYKVTLGSLEKERDLVKKQSAEADLQDLTRNAQSSSAKAFAAANAVGAPGDDPETLRAKRALANNTAKMQDGTKILTEAEQHLAVIHTTADDTLGALDDQRKKIRNIAGTTADIDQELTQVQRILRKMQKELLKNKLMLAGVIAILLIAIFGVLYYKFGGTSGGDASSVSSPTADDTSAPTSAAPPGATTSVPIFIPTLPPSLRR